MGVHVTFPLWCPYWLSGMLFCEIQHCLEQDLMWFVWKRDFLYHLHVLLNFFFLNVSERIPGTSYSVWHAILWKLALVGAKSYVICLERRHLSPSACIFKLLYLTQYHEKRIVIIRLLIDFRFRICCMHFL